MSKWPGRALVIPRTSFPAEKSRNELNVPAVYVLVGPVAADGRPTLHIGAADPVCLELERQYDSEQLWTEAIVCASKDSTLNNRQAQYLEARLIRLARDGKRCDLVNQTLPEFTPLSTQETDYAEDFLASTLNLLPVLGVSAFETF